MDFDEAAIAHIAWKDRLFDYLTKRDGSLNPKELALDDKCALGQWIRAGGLRYSTYPEYATLKSQHTRFHKTVGDIVRGACLGLSVRPETVLGTESEYGEASAAVVTAIMGLKRRAETGSRSMVAATGNAGYATTAATSWTSGKPQIELLDWDSSYSVSVGQLDEHHQYLFCLINILQGASGKGKEDSVVGMVLAELAGYAENHFNVEEVLMEQANYPALPEHRREHQAFIARVAEFKKNLAAGMEGNAVAVLGFLKDWLIKHIQQVDKKYSACMNEVGIH